MTSANPLIDSGARKFILTKGVGNAALSSCNLGGFIRARLSVLIRGLILESNGQSFKRKICQHEQDLVYLFIKIDKILEKLRKISEVKMV